MAVAARASGGSGGGRRAEQLAALVERRGRVGDDGRREQQARRSLHFVRKGWVNLLSGRFRSVAMNCLQGGPTEFYSGN